MIHAVLEFGALTGPLPKLGVVVVALLAALALLAGDGRTRAAAMLGALVLSPVLLLGDIWNSPQLRLVHRHPLPALLGALILVAALGGLAVLISRRGALMGLLAVAALPFRVPIQAGGTTSNLLVPLSLVGAAGSLAYIIRVFAGDRDSSDWRSAGGGASPGWIERLLALYVVLYALQSIYSPDFEKALQQMVFFYVPFALMFCLLRRLQWTRLLLRRGVVVVGALAPLMIIFAAVLVYDRRQRDQLVAVGVLALLWAGLVLTLSRSSLGALLVGLGTLGAMRWRARPILLATVAVVVIGIAAVAISPKTFGLNQGL